MSSLSCGPTYNDTVSVNKVESVSFNDIVDLAIIDLASIGVTGIKDMLTIDDHIDGFDVICQILKNTIDRNECINPLDLIIFPYYTANKIYEFKDNFWDFLAGKIARRDLQLIPRTIVCIIGTYLGTLRGVSYEPPYLTNITYEGQFRTQIVANRPFKMIRDGDRFTKDSRYYFMGENNKEVLYRFRLLFKLNLAEYIIRLNENLEHPNMPINTFQGLQNYAGNLRSEYDELEKESFSYYGIYSNQ